jgi:hypothetical protein
MRIDRSTVDPETERWRLYRGKTGLSFADVANAWVEAPAFRAAWIAGLRDVPFDGFCWECPPATTATASRPFECVFVASPALARFAPDATAFAGQFRTDCSVVTFGNLGGDAMLVAPCPGPGDYAHLARFTATAPASRQDALWQAVGAAVQRQIGRVPTWLSTAGLGVAWLHVRLDSRPKYYRYAPYKSPVGRSAQ